MVKVAQSRSHSLSLKISALDYSVGGVVDVILAGDLWDLGVRDKGIEDVLKGLFVVLNVTHIAGVLGGASLIF